MLILFLILLLSNSFYLFFIFKKNILRALEKAREGLQAATRQLQDLTTHEQQLTHQLTMAQDRHERLQKKQVSSGLIERGYICRDTQR